MKTIRNKKGSIQFGVNFIIKIVLFFIITGAAILIFDNVMLADIKAQTAVRNFGAAFDALALSPKDASIDVNCPADTVFIINGQTISATMNSYLGHGFAIYNYLNEEDASLPSMRVIDCGIGGIAVVSKTYDRDTLIPVISVA